MILFEQRASTILFNLLIAGDRSKRFLLPANVCPIVPLTFCKAGVPFDLIDISPTTLCMDEEMALDAIRQQPGRYRGLVFVRTDGVEVETTPFFDAVREADESFFTSSTIGACRPQTLPRQRTAPISCCSVAGIRSTWTSAWADSPAPAMALFMSALISPTRPATSIVLRHCTRTRSVNGRCSDMEIPTGSRRRVLRCRSTNTVQSSSER